MTWVLAFSIFARRFASSARCFSSRAWWTACCSVKVAVICDGYRGFANISLTVEVLAVAVSSSDEEDGKNGIVEGDTSRCFPLSDAEETVVSHTWVFVPWHPPASRQCWWHILPVHDGWSHMVVQSTIEHERELVLEELRKALSVVRKGPQDEGEMMLVKMRQNRKREEREFDRPMRGSCSGHCWRASWAPIISLFSLLQIGKIRQQKASHCTFAFLWQLISLG